jgi:hypothetical protein
LTKWSRTTSSCLSPTTCEFFILIF